MNADIDKPVRKYISNTFHVKDYTPIVRVLWDLQMNGRQMVIVEDTHRKSVGILTLEDIMERVVGNIIDEYDSGAEHKPHE